MSLGTVAAIAAVPGSNPVRSVERFGSGRNRHARSC
jgi:hypothetical protein